MQPLRLATTSEEANKNIGNALNPSTTLVNRIWRLCTLLRKDGVTYQQYVNEITYLIFLKMMKERYLESILPVTCRWDRLLEAGDDLLEIYKAMLLELRTASNSEGRLEIIFSDANSIVRDTRNLSALIEAIDELPWYDNGRDNFGDIYEGILEKNAEEAKRGAGQYFTARVVVDAIIKAIQPKSGEVIQDPAAGTGGFLIGANEYILKIKNKSAGNVKSAERHTRFVGMENVPDTYRLLLMNLMLHEIDTKDIFLGDTLSADYLKIPLADLILSNPPFGSAGGRPTRDDLKFTSTVSNYQLPFVEHCLNSLSDNGRAAIIVPDNVLFEEGRARDLRTYILDEFDLHTVLRLPGGIFYAAGVKTNVLFLNRRRRLKKSLTWIYDLRTDMPTFGKSTPLREAVFQDFLNFYGRQPDGSDRPINALDPAATRFKAFSREDLAGRDDDLDVSWLQESTGLPEAHLTDPTAISAAIASHLRHALAKLDEIQSELSGATEGVPSDN